jgi:hypothetical protein
MSAINETQYNICRNDWFRNSLNYPTPQSAYSRVSR